MMLQVFLKQIVPASIVCSTKAKIQKVKGKQDDLCKSLWQNMHVFKTKMNMQQILATFSSTHSNENASLSGTL